MMLPSLLEEVGKPKDAQASSQVLTAETATPVVTAPSVQRDRYTQFKRQCAQQHAVLRSC